MQIILNIKFRHVLLLSLLTLLSWQNSRAQDRYEVGLMPVINLNKKVNADYKINVKLESRHLFYTQDNFTFEHELIDLATLLTRRMGLNSRLSAGVLIRRRNQQWVTRSIQQFALIQNLSTLRLGHRFVTDQTFIPSERISWRLRYRLSSEFPLQGTSVDPNEFYLKGSNEYLYQIQGDQRDLEIRLLFFLGYSFPDKSKLEIGFDNRFDSFIEDTLQSITWCNISWYITL